MAEKTVSLKPCLTCGGEGAVLKESDFYAFRCMNPECPQSEPSGIFESGDEAADAWNKLNTAVPDQEEEGS